MLVPIWQVMIVRPLWLRWSSRIKWAGIGLFVFGSLLRPVSIGCVISVLIWVLPSIRLARILMVDILASATANRDFDQLPGAVKAAIGFRYRDDFGGFGHFQPCRYDRVERWRKIEMRGQ